MKKRKDREKEDPGKIENLLLLSNLLPGKLPRNIT